jgi:hypothetical protein
MNTNDDQPTAPVERLVMRCDLCRWWKPIEISEGVLQNCHPDDRDGECRRFPPVQNIAAAIEESSTANDRHAHTTDTPLSPWIWVFPYTDGATYCGEFVSA